MPHLKNSITNFIVQMDILYFVIFKLYLDITEKNISFLVNNLSKFQIKNHF
jgi:hypothetical protein